MQLRIELVPGLLVQTQRHFDLGRRALFIPGYGHDTDVRPDRRQRSRSAESGLIADANSNEHRLLREVRKSLGAVDPNSAGIVELDSADDSVPACTDRV